MHPEKAALMGELPTPTQHSLPKPRLRHRRDRFTHALLATLAAASLLHHFTPSLFPSFSSPPAVSTAPKCTQVDPIFPTTSPRVSTALSSALESPALRDKVVDRLSNIVKIPSESFDDMGAVGGDARWEIFEEVAAYLAEAYPAVHDKLSLEKINSHGLLFTWAGSDESLKPLVLMAHQDVVPVDRSTWSQWTYSPFSGHYDGQYVWGRGSIDCKSVLTSVMVAIDELIAAGWSPKRTVLLSFGFDEEISGYEGAGHLAPFIVERYGNKGVAAIVDEGGGFTESWGSTFGLPAVAEKGYIDVDIIVRVPGGHSSMPPVHDAIGVMADLITLIEKNQYAPKLYNENPYLSIMQCGNEHAADFPPSLSKLLDQRTSESSGQDELALEAQRLLPASKYLFTTTVAADIIGGGVKINALPERVLVSVNHRVNVGENVQSVKDKLTHLATAIGGKYNLTVDAFTDGDEVPGSIKLAAWPNELQPAPVTPTGIDEVTPYKVLAGTSRAVYGENITISPGIMTGNTDTRYYWDVTPHIFRFAPLMEGVGKDIIKNGVHTVNEHVSVLAVMNGVKWYTAFIQNMDEAELVD